MWDWLFLRQLPDFNLTFFSGESGHRGVDGPNRQIWDTVIVRNLPADLDWQELREFFETCGEVKNAMIKERGVGLVRFSSERSAENAISEFFFCRICQI